jgi:hypothetical protein
MKTWLFRPFERIAGAAALALGLLLIALTAALAARAGLQTVGVIDLHIAAPGPIAALILQGLVNWLSLSLMLLIVALGWRRGRFRILDLIGTQALARWPLLPGTIYLSMPAISNRIEQSSLRLLAAMPDEAGQVMAPPELFLDAIGLLLLSLPALIAVGWMIWLMFHAFTLVTDLSGQRAGFGFIGALIAAEILSKLAIHALTITLF